MRAACAIPLPAINFIADRHAAARIHLDSEAPSSTGIGNGTGTTPLRRPRHPGKDDADTVHGGGVEARRVFQCEASPCRSDAHHETGGNHSVAYATPL